MGNIQHDKEKPCQSHRNESRFSGQKELSFLRRPVFRLYLCLGTGLFALLRRLLRLFENSFRAVGLGFGRHGRLALFRLLPDVYIQQLHDAHQRFIIRLRAVVLPAGNGLAADIERRRQLFLRHALGFACISDSLTQAFHIGHG